MKNCICIGIILVLCMAVTGEAKWMAMRKTSTLKYDRTSKNEITTYTTKALGMYDNASTCLQVLQAKFKDVQDVCAGGKGSSWGEFCHVLPDCPMMIHSEQYSGYTLILSTLMSFSCEEERE